MTLSKVTLISIGLTLLLSKMFLSPEIILEGYNKGIFPMADSFNAPFIYWVDPKERGIIKLNEFKISRSLKKELKKKLLSY